MCECVGFEVCDVYYFYYGCMCLIEILEGLNIGLINLLFLFVKVNEFGFIEILYCRVDLEIGFVIGYVDYLIVDEEDNYVVV